MLSSLSDAPQTEPVAATTTGRVRVSPFWVLSAPAGRLLVATLGAACALGLGAATAYAVRLPSDLQAPDASADQVLLQDELPSVTAARSNAIDNPPASPVRSAAAERVQIDSPAAGSSDSASDASIEDADAATEPQEAPPTRAAAVRAEEAPSADPAASGSEPGRPAS